jgi:KDO2-lipid IV(A) lauroyltransferase
MKNSLTYFFKRPKYWLGLIFMGFCWLIAKLPVSVQIFFANRLSWILLKLAKKRKRIAAINLKLCFPDKTEDERETLLKENFRQTALGIVEIASCWFTDLKSRRINTDIIGKHYLEEAQAQGNGVILLIFHLSSMELGGSILGHHFDFNAMYKPNKNKLIEYMMCNGRHRHIKNLIKQNDIRSTVKALKNNEIVWYSTDQNFGNKKGIFAPFFDTQASTITAITKFSKMTGATVIPFTHKRIHGDKGIELELHPALNNFPGESAEVDAKNINQFLENYLKQNPANYLWLHQRFRTRPPGEPAIYP